MTVLGQGWIRKPNLADEEVTAGGLEGGGGAKGAMLGLEHNEKPWWCLDQGKACIGQPWWRHPSAEVHDL